MEHDHRQEQYLDTARAAELACCSPRTLEKMRRERRGPAFVRVSRRKVLYRRSDLDSWLAARRVEVQA